jgi:hypothetical protein
MVLSSRGLEGQLLEPCSTEQATHNGVVLKYFATM